MDVFKSYTPHTLVTEGREKCTIPFGIPFACCYGLIPEKKKKFQWKKMVYGYLTIFWVRTVFGKKTPMIFCSC
jgi:hypothetical protein